MSGASGTAWAWVLEHSTSIERLSRDRARRFGLDGDDVRQSVTVRLVEKFDRYDPSRSSPGTWIWWKVREVIQSTVRKGVATEEISEDLVSSSPSFAERFHARDEINKIRSIATSEQVIVLESILEGWSGAEVRDRLGISLPARNARLYRLRDRYLKTANRKVSCG